MGAVSLTGQQYEQLHEAVRKAFNYDDLKMCIKFRLNARLDEFVSSPAPFATQVMQLLDWAEKQSKLHELVTGLRQCNNDNEFLKAAEKNIFGTAGIALTANEASAAVKRDVESLTQTDPKLQALLGSKPGLPISVGEQEERVRRAKVCIARVEWPEGNPAATGFLVAPDLLLTNDHVRVDCEFDKSPKKIAIRFGYARSAGVANSGAVYKLAEKWLVAFSKDDDLDYCLVRLSTEAGNDPQGTYVGAPTRGWLVPAADAVQRGTIVTILGHPRGEALMQASGIVTDLPAGWLDYSALTLPGSSGSAVLNERWELVGLHSRENDAVSNRGVNLAAILKDLPEEVRELLKQVP